MISNYDVFQINIILLSKHLSSFIVFLNKSFFLNKNFKILMKILLSSL